LFITLPTLLPDALMLHSLALLKVIYQLPKEKCANIISLAEHCNPSVQHSTPVTALDISHLLSTAKESYDLITVYAVN